MGGEGRNLTYLAWDDERDGLDGLRGGDFVRACDFALRCVDCAPRDEAHPALRIARFVLVQRVKVIALVFIVPDISVALASYDHGSRGVWADAPREGGCAHRGKGCYCRSRTASRRPQTGPA